MRCLSVLLPALLALSATTPACAQGITLNPLFGTQFRYQQSTADRLLGDGDAILFRARPGIAVETGAWSLIAESDAALAIRRTEQAGVLVGRSAHRDRPEEVQLNRLQLQYRGLPSTIVAVGRQQLDLFAAGLTGDRDGEQTFDAARIHWKGFTNVSADFAYAWASRSLWARDEAGLIPETVGGANLFRKIDWANPFGTFSGFAYQIDQRRAATTDFRFVSQAYGARFTGQRRIGEDIRLNYTLGYSRQTGALTTPVTGTPTYWQIAGAFDFDELSGTRIDYRRFAANGISLRNGDELTLATSATRGRVTVGARFSDFRAVDSEVPLRDLRVSVGVLF